MPKTAKTAAATLTPVAGFDLFANAKTLPNKATTDKSGKNRKTITLPGIERLAMLDAVEKASKGFKETTKSELEDAVMDEFLGTGFAGGMPESFDAIEGHAKANVQLKRKASNIALNDAEVNLLREVGVEPHEDGIIPELLAFNPEHMKNMDLMKRIQAALATVKDIPADLMVRQEAKTRYVVTAEVADAAWKTGDVEAIRAVTTLAYAPKLEVVDAAAIGETMRNLFQAPEDAPADAESLVKTKLAVEKARVTKAHEVKETARVEKFTSPKRKVKTASLEKA